MLLVSPVLGEDGTVSSYSESVVEGNGNIRATATAIVNAFGAFASSTITITSNGGSVIAIAFAQVYNYGHSVLGITVGGTENSVESTADSSVRVQTINGNSAQVNVGATGNEITVMAIASANDPIQPIVKPVVKQLGFFGYTFGKCDVQRYKHFWLQLRNNNTEDDARALYWMQIIAGENTNYPNGELAMQAFEERYNITNGMPPDETNGNGIENGKWCTLPNNGIHIMK